MFAPRFGSSNVTSPTCPDQLRSLAQDQWIAPASFCSREGEIDGFDGFQVSDFSSIPMVMGMPLIDINAG